MGLRSELQPVFPFKSKRPHAPRRDKVEVVRQKIQTPRRNDQTGLFLNALHPAHRTRSTARTQRQAVDIDHWRVT